MKNTPSFWYPNDNSRARSAFLLWPLSWLWRLGAFLRKLGSSPYSPNVPTIVIGNITAGGTGKTPYVVALAQTTLKSGRNPVILTRGYGGIIAGPHLVSGDDSAEHIGDEAKWLAQHTPVVVARDRRHGAEWIEANIPDCDLIIMDDGLQNPNISPDCKIAVFNGKLGIGNGMIIPAGPLREPWSALRQYDAIVITGDDQTDIKGRMKTSQYNLPVFKAERFFKKNDIANVNANPAIAFAGIGDPDSFFTMLQSEGVTLVKTVSFPDHHPFTSKEIARLKVDAEQQNAVLLTTEKDMMRLGSDQAKDIKSIGLVTVIEPSFMSILPKAKV